MDYSARHLTDSFLSYRVRARRNIVGDAWRRALALTRRLVVSAFS